jgi:transmembrane sensor
MHKNQPYNRYDELAYKLLNGTITEAEKQEYMQWLNQEDDTALDIPHDFVTSKQQLENRILSNLQINRTASIYRKLARRKWWAAAAIILLISSSLYFFLNNKEKQLLAKNDSSTDILPGHDGALLTLADGRQLALDSLGNGIIATQGKTDIIIRNGQLIYNAGTNTQEILYNTMTTAKGRQYQLVLPDGTKVWLNAASSINYPAAFTGDERNVSVTGEVYFEVARNKEKPFIVDVNKQSKVKVLGTSFNINAYTDEEDVKTTLLEGSVRIMHNDAINDQYVILKPGQQAVVKQENIKVNTTIDTDETIAWKNGYFQFNETDLKTVLKQLQRWYDIEVVFEGNISNEKFIGQLPRNAPLSQILRVLAKTQVKFKIEGKKLIVTS